MVVASTKDHARAAAKKVVVDLEPLPEYMSYLEAVKPEAERIHDSFDNIYSTQPVLKGDYDHVAEMIDNAPYAVDGSFYSSREPHLSIEGDTVQAYYDEDNKVLRTLIHGSGLTLAIRNCT